MSVFMIPFKSLQIICGSITMETETEIETAENATAFQEHLKEETASGLEIQGIPVAPNEMEEALKSVEVEVNKMWADGWTDGRMVGYI